MRGLSRRRTSIRALGRELPSRRTRCWLCVVLCSYCSVQACHSNRLKSQPHPKHSLPSLLNRLKRILPRLPRLSNPPLLNIPLHLLTPILARRHGLAPRPPIRHNARPRTPHQLGIPQIIPILGGPTSPHLRTRSHNPDAQNARTTQLRLGRRPPAPRPAPGQQVIRNALHGPQRLGGVADAARVPVAHGGAVVARVVEGREGQDQPVEERGGQRDGQPRAGSVRAVRENPPGYVPVDVDVLRGGGGVGGRVGEEACAA